MLRSALGVAKAVAPAKFVNAHHQTGVRVDHAAGHTYIAIYDGPPAVQELIKGMISEMLEQAKDHINEATKGHA